MSKPAGKSLASLLILAVVVLQFAPATIRADDTVAAPVETVSAETSSSSAPESTPESASQSDTPSDTQSDTSSTADQQSAIDAGTAGGSGSASAAVETESAGGSTQPQTAAGSAGETSGTQTASADASDEASPVAEQSVAGGSGAGTSETSSASESSQNSTQSSTSSSSASLDATSTGTTTAESHDNLDLHATSTDPTFSINGVLDEIDNVATTSQAGIVGGGGGAGAGSPAEDTATGTPFQSPLPSATSSSSEDASSSPSREDLLGSVASDTPTIISGTATAIANILNILNSTFVNSSGAILFQNFINPAGTIDFRDPALFFGLCNQASCSGSTGLQINLLNDGTIDNNLIVSANSGRNDLSSNAGGAIFSGDAFAGLNLINLANVTIANSNYLLIALNAFRGINGDIVFPSLSDFFASLLTGGAGDIALNNSATVNNDVAAESSSGENNTVMGPNGTSTILTGSSNAQANVFNQINSLLAGSGLSIFLRLSGDWNGEVQGAPDWLSWTRTSDGILFSAAASGTPGSLGASVNGTSTADIGNRVRVGALSGQNDLSASTTGLIATGDSFAGANVINVANQTVIGRNWIMAIINVFGNFTGNIAFGKPDLWVGAQVQAPGEIHPGDVLQYKLTVINNGDAQATNAKLRETIDAAHVSVVDASLPYVMDGSTMLFDLGTLPRGKASEITYRAQVNAFNAGESIVSNTVAGEHESDNNPADNADTTTVRNAWVGGGGSGGYVAPVAAAAPIAAAGATSTPTATSTAKAALTVTRTTPSILVAHASSSATETLVVRNESANPAQGVTLNDVIRDAAGAIVHTESFDIGAMAPYEEVTITYDMAFSEMRHGRFTLWSEITGANIDAHAYQNGDISFVEPSLPVLPDTIAPLSGAAPAARTHAILPLIPNAGAATWTAPESVHPDNEQLAAAAGSIDGAVSDGYIRLVSFGLLLLSIFGALRLFVFRPF